MPEYTLDNPYAIIPLSGKHGRGLVAKVSPEDVPLVSAYRWYGLPSGYAVTYKALPGNTFMQVLMHRLIMGVVKGDGQVVDHRDSVRLDNRRTNLRVTTYQGNARNRVNRQRGQIVGYTGVHKQAHDKKWKAFITVDYKHYYLGGYATSEEAARAYDAVARYQFGEYAVCNFEGTEARSIEAQRALAAQSKKLTSLYRGVKWAKEAGKWKAQLGVNGTRYNLGSFVTELDAARAYDEARISHGLPRINFSE